MERDERETEVLTITAVGPPEKTPRDLPAWHRGTWRLPVRYSLADGTEHETFDYCSRKRDAVAFAETLPAAPVNPLAVTRDESGEIIGTRTTYRLGGVR